MKSITKKVKYLPGKPLDIVNLLSSNNYMLNFHIYKYNMGNKNEINFKIPQPVILRKHKSRFVTFCLCHFLTYFTVKCFPSVQCVLLDSSHYKWLQQHINRTIWLVFESFVVLIGFLSKSAHIKMKSDNYY